MGKAFAAEVIRLQKRIFTLDVCPSTLGHFRNDWPLIFPLRNERLMLVWCEYYATRPSEVLPGYTPGNYSDPAPCRISAKISTDRGRSWSDTFTLQDNIGPLNVKHPNLLRLASDPSKILFVYTVRYSDTKEIRIFMKRSHDECETWSEPVQISSLPGVHYLMADRILQLDSGRIILPVFQSDSWYPFDAFCYYSDDDGDTWQISKTKMKLPGHGAQEPSVAVLKNGSLLAMLRTSLGALYKSYSHDGGENWTEPVSTGLPSPASTPLLKRIPTTGDLLLIWNNAEPDANNGHYPRDPLTAAVSKDEGKTWQNIKDIENNPGGLSSTPAASFLGDKVLVIYWYMACGLRGGSIRLKTIPVDWFYDTSPIRPAKRSVDVFLLAGQSNATGRADAADIPSELKVQEDVMFYRDTPGERVALSKKTWLPLQAGSGADTSDRGPGTYFGPEISLGRTIADNVANHKIALVKYYMGGTNLANDWDPDSTSGLMMYANFLTTAQNATEILANRGYSVQIKGMLWFQGGNDSNYADMSSAYEANLTNFIARLRSDLGVPNLPFIIAPVVGKSTQTTHAYRDTVRVAQLAVAERDSNTHWVKTNDLQLKSDGFHLSANGMIRVGQRFAEIALSRIYSRSSFVLNTCQGQRRKVLSTVILRMMWPSVKY
jgi:sialidase-1